MQTEEFIEEVRMNLLRNHAIRMTDGDIWSAIESTLQTLAEQLEPDDTLHIAQQLPEPFAGFMQPYEARDSLELDLFFERVAEMEAVDLTVASYYVRAVLQTLAQTLNDDDLAQLQSMLPQRFRSLFERGMGDEIESEL
jgi:uncharacterized protein (DUF2267 family)